MRTAVSVPDGVFRMAEQLAQDRRMSRSELYTRALDEYVHKHQRHDREELLGSINRVCDRVDTGLDAATKALRDASLPKGEW